MIALLNGKCRINSLACLRALLHWLLLEGTEKHPGDVSKSAQDYFSRLEFKRQFIPTDRQEGMPSGGDKSDGFVYWTFKNILYDLDEIRSKSIQELPGKYTDCKANRFFVWLPVAMPSLLCLGTKNSAAETTAVHRVKI